MKLQTHDYINILLIANLPPGSENSDRRKKEHQKRKEKKPWGVKKALGVLLPYGFNMESAVVKQGPCPARKAVQLLTSLRICELSCSTEGDGGSHFGSREEPEGTPISFPPLLRSMPPLCAALHFNFLGNPLQIMC
jgi:hypothetical protein